jgi:hypothetical protein
MAGVQTSLNSLNTKVNSIDTKVDSLERGMLEFKTELKQHEVRLGWGMFFAVSCVTIFAITHLLIMYSLQVLRL